MEGGHLLSLGVALKRAFINSSELSVCSIRGFGGWIGGLVPVQSRPWRRRSRGPQKCPPDIPARKLRGQVFHPCASVSIRGRKSFFKIPEIQICWPRMDTDKHG